MASLVAAWAAVFLLAKISSAAPSLSFPINSQVPPVARIGQPFSFVFSPSTFSSPSAVTYSITTGPPWLSIDSAARRLFGTPGDADIGPGQVVGVLVTLLAADITGAATHDLTLVVSRSPSPRVNLPLEKQIPGFGAFSAPSSILSAPQTQFSFNLAPDTFINPSNTPLSYYAVMADNTPLPAWISFSSAGLTFSGRTPPSETLVQTPQRFGFQVVASDVVGFAAVSLQFDIVVGTDLPKGGDPPLEKHQLTADKTMISINAMTGSALSYTGLRETVKVDGKAATADNVAILSVTDFPAWLTVDNDTWALGGVPPEAAKSARFTMTIQENLSKTTLNVTIQVEIKGTESQPSLIFKGDIPTLTATAGEPFSFDLGEHLANITDTDISISADPSADWMHFDLRSVVISGDVPKDLADTIIVINIQAKARSLGNTATVSLTILCRGINQIPAAKPSGTEPSTSVHEETPGPTDNSLATTSGDLVNGPPSPMLAAVLVPTIIIIILLTCLLFWYYRRRKEEERPRLTTRDISEPLPGTFVRNDSYGPPIDCHDIAEAQGHSQQSSHTRLGSLNTSSKDQFVSEQKEYLKSRSTYMSNAGIPRPQATVRLLPPIEARPTDADDVFGTGTVPLLTPIAPIRPLRLTRHDLRSELRNERSLSSISETSYCEPNVTVIPITAGTKTKLSQSLVSPNSYAGTPFRDTVEVYIPTFNIAVSSITQSPESAYTAPRSTSMSAAGSFATLHKTNGGLCTQSRLGHYPRMRANSTRKFAWPWLKKRVNFDKAAEGVKKHARKLSFATVDTFTYKKTASSPGARSDEKSPPRLTKLPQMQTVGESSRPVTRRGPVAGQGQTWGGSFHRACWKRHPAEEITTTRAW